MTTQTIAEPVFPADRLLQSSTPAMPASDPTRRLQTPAH
jgi:hypothetical protein